MKKVTKISIFTLPLSIGFFIFMEIFQGFVMGGLATTKGFPIPYYRDVWFTPGVDFSVPILKYIDILIIYIVLTLIVYKIKEE